MRLPNIKALASAVAISSFTQSVVTTNFLDHHQLLSGVTDPAWYKSNVAILDTPSEKLLDVYYYRWHLYRQHIYYTSPQYSYVITEFLGPVSWAGPYGGIAAAAGHHINEGRWLRDQRPVKNYIDYWLNGPGLWPKDSTHNWAHDYSFWAASSIYQHYLVTGDLEFVAGHFDNLIAQYRGWDDHFNATFGLFWQIPDRDGTEQSAATYETGDDGPGYRPTINSYQYGDAQAIAALAEVLGRRGVAREYSQRAEALQKAMETYLWDSKTKFFKHMQRDNNTENRLVKTREIMGYLPWMFGMVLDTSKEISFKQLFDPFGFKSEFGPLTAENRSVWFMHDAYPDCCHWDGPSWPYATSQTLTAVENLLNDQSRSGYSIFTRDDYYDLLSRYVNTQYRNDKPYVGEAHDPYADDWMYDIFNRSEDYNHSTFIDNIITGLIGLRAQSGNRLVVNPLIPTSWNYFGLENVPYHGHSITVLWDRNGRHYRRGDGLAVWVDGYKIGQRNDVGPLTVNVGETKVQKTSTDINVAANTQKHTQGSHPSVSYNYTEGSDSPWGPVDGLVLRAGIPQNSRWTSYGSSSPSDWFQVDLRQNQSISLISLFFYDDGGGVQVPADYTLEYWLEGRFVSIPRQSRPETSVPNGETRVSFPPITTSRLRIVASNRGGGAGWGLSEFQVWVKPIYQLENVNSGKLIGIGKHALHGSGLVQQSERDGSTDQQWEIIPAYGGWHKILNRQSHQVLTVTGDTETEGARVQQSAYIGSSRQLWKVDDRGEGRFVMKNKGRDELVVGVDKNQEAEGASIVLFNDDGSTSHLWLMLPSSAS